jgi:hypothetical protein
MSDIAKARFLFLEAGLAFPKVPAELAERLKEHGRWWFTTRDDDTSPYILEAYVKEAKRRKIDDYVVLAHSGHGINSYAIQYYLVYGRLRMFLFLGWGGVYMDATESAAQIKLCFSLADDIVRSLANNSQPGRVTIVASDFLGSYWSGPRIRRKRKRDSLQPAVVLGEVLAWLNGETRSMRSATTARDS